MHISISTQTQSNSNKFGYNSIGKTDENKKTSLLKSKSNDIIKGLMKQRDNLIESKQKLIDRKLKEGESSGINEQLKDIDKQIEEVNSQISKIQLEDQRKALGTEDKDKQSKTSKEKQEKTTGNSNKTDGSVEMSNILTMANNVGQTKILLAQRNSMIRETGVINEEIKLDVSRGVNPKAKIKRVSEMEENISNIGNRVGNILNENEKVSNSHSDDDDKNVDNSHQEDKQYSKVADVYSNTDKQSSKSEQKGKEINSIA